MNVKSDFSSLVRGLFNLDEDKAQESEIIDSIRKDISFRGTNLWTLIFAMFIASIGLNLNSPAVLIGAMLISPLMGPIMGIGLGIGIYDFELIKKGIKNIVIAAVMSIVISWLYFLITPLHEASSELLARTRPTLWDVFIAFLGGMAGIIAGTRKKKSNVIPGVAIATTLMPPLCTAGFGLATGQYYYVLGALYLFSINCLFICVATVIMVRYLKFRKIEFPSEEQRKRVTQSIYVLVAITLLPSIYLTWKIVRQTIFEEKAKVFVQNEFQMTQTQVVSRVFKYDAKTPVIELLVLGEELSPHLIDSLNALLPRYDLANARLVIRQGLDAEQKIDLAQIRASIVEDVFKNQSLNLDTADHQRNNNVFPDLSRELKSLHPGLIKYSLSQAVSRSPDTTSTDTVTLFWARFNEKVPAAESQRLTNWLKVRLGSDSLKAFIE